MSWIITYPPEYYLQLGGEEQQTRWVYNFNGVDNYIDTGQKIVDVDNLDGLTLEGVFDSDISGTMFAQNISSTAIDREFQIYNFGPGTNTMLLIVGGESVLLLSPANMPSERGLYRFEFVSGNIVRTLFNGALLSSVVYTAGIKREPTATFKIMARGDGAGAVGFLRSGICYDVKINDGSVYNYPINDRTFGVGAPIANSATVLGSNLWGGQNLTVANIGVVTTVVSGEAWDVYSLNGSPLNVVHGARVNVFSGLTDGEQYLYDVDSSEPVNIAVYNTNYQLISGGTVENGKGILFTHNGTSRVYVCPRTTNTVRVSNGRVRLANGYATGVNLLESGWTEINT